MAISLGVYPTFSDKPMSISSSLCRERRDKPTCKVGRASVWIQTRRTHWTRPGGPISQEWGCSVSSIPRGLIDFLGKIGHPPKIANENVMIQQYTPCLDKAWMLGRSKHSLLSRSETGTSGPPACQACAKATMHCTSFASCCCSYFAMSCSCARYGRFSFSLPVSQYPRRLQKFLVPTP